MKPTHFIVPWRHLLKLTGCLILILLLETMAFAQVDRAELEGTVTDQSGASVTGVAVKILAVGTDITAEQKTNSNGYYRFPGLAVG